MKIRLILTVKSKVFFNENKTEKIIVKKIYFKITRYFLNVFIYKSCNLNNIKIRYFLIIFLTKLFKIKKFIFVTENCILYILQNSSKFHGHVVTGFRENAIVFKQILNCALF